MNILFWGLTVSMFGKVLLAIGVLLAHSKIVHEHKIDMKVLKGFRQEFLITVLGLVLIVLGYFMELYFYGFTPFLTCSGEECMASIQAAFPQ